jgi:hypothetical protein
MSNDDRPSFSKEKITQHNVGPTGITGTRESSVTPSSNLKATKDGRYNASELLFENIDKLGELFHRDEEDEDYVEIDTIDLSEDLEEDFDSLTEEEVVKNLDHHLNLNPSKKQSSSSGPNDKFCRSCGQKFLQGDNFCGNCGTKRQKAN